MASCNMQSFHIIVVKGSSETTCWILARTRRTISEFRKLKYAWKGKKLALIKRALKVEEKLKLLTFKNNFKWDPNLRLYFFVLRLP